MGSRHLWLVLLFVTTLVTLNQSTTPASTTSSSLHSNLNSIEDDDTENLINHKYSKTINKKITTDGNNVISTTQSTDKVTNDTKKDKKDRTIPLALDPRYNKMLPSHTNLLKDNSNDLHDDDDSDEEYLDDYYDDYDDDSTDNKTEINKKLVTEKPKKIYGPLSPIKKEEKSMPKKSIEKLNEKEDEDDYDDDNDDDYDEDDDDIADEEDVVFSENVPCPRYCLCAKNFQNFLVATCMRLDADTQKFGTGITDLVVVDVPPKYPIMLGPEFFVKIGLKRISSIKISNCTIQLLHPTAFHGLDYLFNINLTNVGLTSFHSNIFEQNKALRLVTISGNDLSVMTKRASELQPLIKSSYIQELDLSNNNLNDLPATSFNQLSNIVYINLSNNNIKNLPETIFDSVETIEELDLSINSIVSLPSNIFNRTALSILRLHHNEITNDLHFGTSDLQILDLSFCSIQTINNHMFNKMTGLTNLILKANGLKRIQPDSFVSLKNLRHIDLSTNDLEQLSSLLFYNNIDLSVIKLNDNPKLSELPTDGFQCVTGHFQTYLLDISNCAIGQLGPTTFSHMPDISILKLSWNNINNLDKATFKYLENLTELDLSNNLIVKLYNQTFLHNRGLVKLNLAGNPIQELSNNLFYPLNNLKDLDISDCELQTMFTNDNNYIDLGFKYYDTLKSLNISFNKIKKLSKNDIQYFKNLRTFDINNNLLQCNEDFINLIKYLMKKNIIPGKVLEKMNMDKEYNQLSENIHEHWKELELNVCKRSISYMKPTQSNKIDFDKPTKIITNYKKLSKDEDKKILDKLNEETIDSNESNNNDDDYDDDDYDNAEDDVKELNDDKIIKTNNVEKENKKIEKPIKDNGLFVDDINILKETKDKFLRDKLTPSDTDTYDDDDDYDNDEEIIVGTTKIYYSTNYRFIPILVVLLFVIVLLLIIGKIVSILLLKRGERYRMAILASKNSIIYQKLSEEIASTEKLQKDPKVHKYAKINQV